MFAIIDQQWNNLVYIRKNKRYTKAVAKYSINKKDKGKISQWEYIEIIYNEVNIFKYKRWVQTNSSIKATKKTWKFDSQTRINISYVDEFHDF